MNRSAVTISNLNNLVRSLNDAYGYTNRYRLQQRHGIGHAGKVFAVVCSQGPLDRNETGWLRRGELDSWLHGALVSIATCDRRKTRADLEPTRLVGYLPDHA